MGSPPHGRIRVPGGHSIGRHGPWPTGATREDAVAHVQQGIDLDRVRAIASEVARLGDDVQTVARLGRTQMGTLTQAWDGQDLE